MSELKVLWVNEPRRESAKTSGDLLYDPERFASKLAGHLGALSRRDGWLRDIDLDETLIVLAPSDSPTWAASEVSPQVAARTVVLGASTPHLCDKLLEPYSLAGAIDTFSLLGDRRRERLGAQGLYALREPGLATGAKAGPFRSARYCVLTSTIHDGLPHLLADYLQALWRQRNF
jgi:hypothetical protein